MIARYRRQQQAVPVGNSRAYLVGFRYPDVPRSLHTDALLERQLGSATFGSNWWLYLHMYPIYAAYARNSRDSFKQSLPGNLRTQPNWWENAK